MIILKIWMSVVLDVFRHMFYHKCMIILVAVFQNNKESAVFSLDKVYSGIDLCMKIGLNSSMYLYPFYTNLLPPPPPPLPLHPLACLFQLFIFISCFMSGSIAVPSIVWWEYSCDVLKAWAICMTTSERTIIRLYAVEESMKMTVLMSIVPQEPWWQFKYGKNLKNECKNKFSIHVFDREVHYLQNCIKQYMAK